MRKSVLYSLILAGITSVSAQIILIREFFTAFYGNELSIGFILLIWLLGGLLGSGIIGSVFVDKIKRKLLLFSFLQISLAVLVPAGIVFARTSRLLFDIGTGEIVSAPVFIFSSGVALLPCALSLGFIFVLGCKIIERPSPSGAIGRVYTLEAIGAALGGTITNLVLIRCFGPLHIAFMLSALNLIAAFFLASAKRAKYLAVVLLCVLFVFAIFGGINELDQKSTALKWRPFKVLESKESIYGRTTVTERNAQLNFFNNGLFIFSSHDRLTAEGTAHFAMIFNPRAKNVLLIGGGASEITSEILKYPVDSLDYVELNPAIISLSKDILRKKPFYKLDEARVNVKTADGRYFIKNSGKLYDVIILTAPNPYTAQINRFYTVEFFREVKKIMSESAVFSFSVSSSENYLSREQALFLKALLETAESEFAQVEIIPGDAAYYICANKKGMISLNPGRMAGVLKKHGIDTTHVRDYYLISKLSEGRLSFLYSALQSAGEVRKNLDFYPICYFYDMALWSTRFNFKIAGFLKLLTKKRLLLFTFSAFIAIFVVFFVRRRSKNFKKETALLALCTTGLSEISFEILIILAFQIIYGYLYYQIGIILTSFMIGLGFGSGFITKRLPKLSRPFKTYIGIQAFVLIYPLILLACFRLFSSLSAYPALRQAGAGLFAFLPFIAGFAGGMQYPLANEICLDKSSSVAKTAGGTYAIDLLGAVIGAFFVSAFFVPILGIPLTCVLISALNAISLILLLLTRNANSRY